MRDIDYDRLVSVFMFTSGREMDRNSLVCHLYFAQRLGFNLDFNFRVNQRGVSSSKAESYIKELLVSGSLMYDVNKSAYSYALQGHKNPVRVCGEDFYLLECLLDLMHDLESWELSFLVTLSILQDDCLERQSSSGMSFGEVHYEVVCAMKRLCPMYTETLFEAASGRLLRMYDLGGVR